MARILFVFAHQDDEIAAASRIRRHVGRGDHVACVYLTDGATRVATAIRDRESRRVLAILGVDDVRFEKIPDGELPANLHRALDLLEREICDEVVTPAWEGGHQDHDAAFLVGAAFAKRRGIRCIELPLYNGHRTFGPFFRVQHPVGDGWTSRRISWFRRTGDVLLCRYYKSQRNTWLGLMPLLLMRPAREWIREGDVRRAQAPPHSGRLLYERRFRYPYSRFAAFAQAFLRSAVLD